MPDLSAVMQQTNFTKLDWVIVILYPLISVGIGLYVRKLITNMSDFVVAGQGLGVCLGIATMTGTEMGLITVMYNAQKGFTGAFAALHIALAAGVVTFFVGLTGLFVFRLRSMGVLTIPEFYERRFDRRTRVLGGITMALAGILNMGLFLQVGSKFIVGITGLSATSAALPVVMVALICLVLIYTCLGGMISVVIADYVQFVVLSLGLIVATVLAVNFVGWDNVFDTVEQEIGVVGFDPTAEANPAPAPEADASASDATPGAVVSSDQNAQGSLQDQAAQGDVSARDTELAAGDTVEADGVEADGVDDAGASPAKFGWEYIVWMGLLGLVSCAIWPTAVARALSMESAQAVKRQYMLASVSFLIRFLIPCFWGICALVFILQDAQLHEVFFPSPEAIANGVEPHDNLYAMPIFLGRILPMGVIGVITAGMIAAFMSTHDSYLLCWSSVLTQDVVAPVYETDKRKLSSKARITLTRVFIVVIGLYVLFWGLVYRGSDDIWDYMAVTGAIYYNGAFALLLGGLYWKQASSRGAFLALLSGVIAVVGLSPVQHGIGVGLNFLAGSSPDTLQALARLPAVELKSVLQQGVEVTQLVFSVPPARVGLFSITVTTLTMIIGSLLLPDRDKPQAAEATAEGGDQ